jgi:hypothetical protein
MVTSGSCFHGAPRCKVLLRKHEVAFQLFLQPVEDLLTKGVWEKQASWWWNAMRAQERQWAFTVELWRRLSFASA